ncbi:MAG: hypothetical protein V3U06_09150, partial [Candidatus Binatia bacterium]
SSSMRSTERPGELSTRVISSSFLISAITRLLLEVLLEEASPHRGQNHGLQTFVRIPLARRVPTF